MPRIFKVAEVVDLGIEKEKRRRDFYARVASRFQEHELKKLFARLRDWEEEHIKKFTQIRDSINEPDPVEAYSQEVGEYMRTLVDDRFYNEVSPKFFSENVKTSLEAINYGIGFEKDAILFFLEMLSFIDVGKRDAIQTLINEEKQHIIYLAEFKKKIAK